MSRQRWRIRTARGALRATVLKSHGPTVLPTILSVLLWAALAGSLSGCAASIPLTVAEPTPLEDQSYGPSILSNKGTEMGIASWYGPGFHGKLTANGERYDQNGLTAAHRTLPLGTWVEVRDLRSDRRVKVRVNDRGPYKKGRAIDLSYGAAKMLGMVDHGTAPVEIRLLDADYSDWPVVLYSVQIGAFSRRFVADRLGYTAAEHGYRAYLKLVGEKSMLYGVRVGPFRERTEAKRIARSLSRDGFDAQLVDEDPRTAGYLMQRASTTADAAASN